MPTDTLPTTEILSTKPPRSAVAGATLVLALGYAVLGGSAPDAALGQAAADLAALADEAEPSSRSRPRGGSSTATARFRAGSSRTTSQSAIGQP